MRISECIKGHFYWIRPCYDVDSDESFDEQYKLQPARYLGNDTWSLLGTEDETCWPVIYIDSEIVPPSTKS